MLSLLHAQAVYPLVVVTDPISPEQFDGPLFGVDCMKTANGLAFPIWHAPLLRQLFGEPDADALGWVEWACQREKALDDIRAGTHPLLQTIAARYPWMHPWQVEAMAFCATSPAAGIFIEPGMGKTAPMCALVRDDIVAQPANRPKRPTLVIASGPDLLLDAWEPELENVAPELRVCNLNNQFARYSRIEPHDIFLVGRQTLAFRQATIRDGLKALGVKRVIVDESYTMANPDTVLATVLGNDWIDVPERILMSGLPAPMGEHQWWTQVNFLAPGLLPVNREEFMRQFFERNDEGRKVVKPERREQLMQRVAKVGLFRGQEVSPLFKGSHILEHHCELPTSPNVRASYDLMRDDLRLQLNRVIQEKHMGLAGFTQRTAQVFRRILRLRELTSGYIVDESGKWQLVSDYRFRKLDEVLDSLGDHQAIIWMIWDADFRMLPHVLPHRAGRAGFIWGATQNKTYRQGVRKRFRAGELQYLFTNPPCQRHGLTLFDPRRDYKCHHAVFFDYNYSLDEFEQAGKRLPRLGQDSVVANHVIICKDTIDETIYARLMQRRQDSDDMHEFLK